MKSQKTISASLSGKRNGVVSDFLVLIKIRLTSMVVFTSIIAYFLAAGSETSLLSVAILMIGGFLVAGASNALNQALEKDYDKLMTRTANRPIAAGRLSLSGGIMIAGFMSLFGISILALFNPLTAFLGMLSLLCYAFVYTPLKRHSSVAVLVGAIPGAMPMLIGCVAFDGYISILALSLFFIQLLWQFPHFWAIGFLSFDEYKKAGYNFIPSKNGVISHTILWQSIVTAAALVPFGFVLGQILELHMLSIILFCLAGILFTAAAIRFYLIRNRTSALTLMFGSLLYLPVILAILMIDQF